LVFAAACVVDDGKVLLQLRDDSRQWGLPGGAVELGEPVGDAALREVYEETGLQVTLTRLVGVYSDYEQTYPNGDVAQPVTVVVEARSSGGHGAVARDESLAVQWFSLDRLPPLWSRLHADALADLAAGKTGVLR
jgi:ADP-ribose pyrophosphatase YjhB (NUDIX family)